MTTTPRTTPAKKTAPTEAEKKAKVARTEALSKAHSAAVSDTIAEHREFFNARKKHHAQAAGIDWKPQPTAEEKALAEAKALLEQHPGLAEQLGLAPAPTSAESTTD